MDPRPWHAAYDSGVPSSLDFEPLALPQFFDRTVERSPDRTAVIFQNKQLSYRQLGDHESKDEPAAHMRRWRFARTAGLVGQIAPAIHYIGVLGALFGNESS